MRRSITVSLPGWFANSLLFHRHKRQLGDAGMLRGGHHFRDFRVDDALVGVQMHRRFRIVFEFFGQRRFQLGTCGAIALGAFRLF